MTYKLRQIRVLETGELFWKANLNGYSVQPPGMKHSDNKSADLKELVGRIVSLDSLADFIVVEYDKQKDKIVETKY